MSENLPKHVSEEAKNLKAIYRQRKKDGLIGNQADVAALAGWQSQGTVSQYMTGRLELNLEALLKFAQVLVFDPAEVSPRLAGLLNAAPRVVHEVTMADAKASRLLPVIGHVQAGSFCEAIDSFHPGDAEEWIESYGPAGPRAFILRVEGFSMEPDFKPGEKVVVDPDMECKPGDFVVAKRISDHAVTLKRLRKEGEAHYLFASNPDWPERVIKLSEEWHLCGRVRRKIVDY
ncbi:LexA family protein [Metapseudomonas furukawaii]|uniref:LexA family protein n=1 Tax=Metapseudomonas furukawaii TaxID=1149133 RepID=UPI001E5611CB|nr:LexA family transcriptional regulator [Pseudomonas furukawaii]